MLELKLSDKEYDLLTSSEYGFDIKSLKMVKSKPSEVIVELDDNDDLIIALTEKAEHILQTQGFSYEYEPTDKGLLCESILDKLSTI